MSVGSPARPGPSASRGARRRRCRGGRRARGSTGRRPGGAGSAARVGASVSSSACTTSSARAATSSRTGAPSARSGMSTPARSPTSGPHMPAQDDHDVGGERARRRGDAGDPARRPLDRDHPPVRRGTVAPRARGRVRLRLGPRPAGPPARRTGCAARRASRRRRAAGGVAAHSAGSTTRVAIPDAAPSRAGAAGPPAVPGWRRPRGRRPVGSPTPRASSAYLATVRRQPGHRPAAGGLEDQPGACEVDPPVREQRALLQHGDVGAAARGQLVGQGAADDAGADDDDASWVAMSSPARPERPPHSATGVRGSRLLRDVQRVVLPQHGATSSGSRVKGTRAARSQP